MSMNCGKENDFWSATEFVEGGESEEISELNEKLEQIRLESGNKDAKLTNVLLVWHLPTVLDLKVLRSEFLGECRQTIPDINFLAANVHARTDKAERKSKEIFGGNKNVIICSYMIIWIERREHAEEMIRVWDQKYFQTKFLNVKFSAKYDCGTHIGKIE